MVIFIFAAAAAFLFCILLRSSKQLQNWLDESAHAFQLILSLSLLAAALLLLILIVAAASTFGVMIFLFSLLTCFVIWGRRSLLSGLAASPPDQQPREWQRNVLYGFVFISPLLPGVLLGRDFIIGLIPDVITSLVDLIVSWVSKILSWVSPQPGSEPSEKVSAVVAICAWLVAVAVLAAGLAINWLRERWQTWLVFSSFLLIAIFSTLTAGHAWAVPAVVAICAWSVATTVLAAGLANNWLRERWQTWLVFSSLVLIAIFSTLIAENGDAWAYAVLLTIHRIASMRETTYAVLGAVAGLMCVNFPRWINYARTHGIGHTGGGAKSVKPEGNLGEEEASTSKPASGLWPVIIFAGALASVVIAALLAPSAPAILGRVTGLETPYLKVQFAISPSLADKQQFLNVKRDLDIYDTLEAFPRWFRFIQFDCAQAALDAGFGIIEFAAREPEKYREFTAGLAFQYSLVPYLNQLQNAQRKGYNPVALKARAREVAEKFAFLATNGDFERNYRTVMSEVERQWQLFKDEGVGEEAAPEELLRQRIDPDPDYCRPSLDEISLALSRLNISNVSNVRMVLQKRPRLILDPAMLLFQFEGNTGAANAMKTDIYDLKQSTDDINAIGGYADALYYEGGDLRETIRVERSLLQVYESRLGKAERAKVWSEAEVKDAPTRETDNKARSDLVGRYNRARFQAKGGARLPVGAA